jgi:glutamate synthase domain-containing protein 2/glutamate synthase domain-containing protein 1/glutamate synthase domain-containing protein 3
MGGSGIRAAERDACGIGFVADSAGRGSAEILALALEALRRVRHRGAVAADARSGDGAGVLLPIPETMFGTAGVGMLFVPPGHEAEGRAIVARALLEEGLQIAGWREVPVDPSALGDMARKTRPATWQVFFKRPCVRHPERRAFRARKRIERASREADLGLYVASLSFSTVVYKALCAADQLESFYPDLTDPRFEVPFAVFHQRYSTNTAPTWERAQPFRFLCHNGEINTIGGNVNLMRAREGHLGAESLGAESLLAPVIDESGSDSAMLDNAVELLVHGGRSLPHALAMLIPEAWEAFLDLDPTVRDFYRYHACLTEPWDGPAALVFTDGRVVGARLDRNGLRPMRYAMADDGLVACGSEVGIVDFEGRGKVRRGRLGPGQILLVDPEAGRVLEDAEVKWDLAARRPYGTWVGSYLRRGERGQPVRESGDGVESTRHQVAFGHTKEEMTVVLRPMALTGHEPTSSMGDDTAEPPLANRGRPVFGFLKQRFAQVTNPPIDHMHERIVMSLATRVGSRAPILQERPDAAALVELPSFFLFPEGLDRLCRGPFRVAWLDATFAEEEGPAGLERASRRLGDEAERAVRTGAGLLAVTDAGIGPDRVPVPSLLAVGAVHHRLLRAGLRSTAGLVADAGDVREVHHFACLLGYGADAVVPRVALRAIAALCEEGRIGGDWPSAEEAQDRFRRAVEEGVLKVMSKMGISTVDAYRAAQIFEAIGLAPAVVDLCLAGTESPLGGVDWDELGAVALERHTAGYGAARPALAHPGFVKHRAAGEYHATNPDVVDALHDALGLNDAGEAPRYDRYRQFAATVNDRASAEPRDLLEVTPAGQPIPIDHIEAARSIVERFSTGAMSHGSLSAEAHETIALALNSIGGKSNTGEGGEDRARYRDGRNSRIKQVASARFGVTPEYLAFADELQIKMAQGSKPGEGGQLPGHKVSQEIARLRHTSPGVTLISPPPHHDIYSIEDLAQLIYDLKQANPRADVSVKLVSTVGVGIIAAGVVKGLADVVHVAGADGGTGASPLSSIKNAGLPWEVGLADTHAELVRSGLRDRARIRVDGGFKTGRDVMIAALLGADEFSFGTSVLLAQGCIMVRACHRDTCPTGIATQRPDLRAKFAGKPEKIAAYLLFVAEEVRELLASLGLTSLRDAVGRTDLLRAREPRPTTLGGAGLAPVPRLDVSPLLAPPRGGAHRFVRHIPLQRPESPLGNLVFELALPLLEKPGTHDLSFPITNSDRAVGARLGAEAARVFGDREPRGRVRIRFAGAAGQSFGAFLSSGVEFALEGEANDYVGKGLGGGRIVVTPPPDDAGDPVLLGNTVLYGATGGELFCGGRAGERFAVRNSGAVAVVEGAGDHACEYMTRGTVLILGPVGRNVGAGMSGGQAFVYDPEGMLPERINGHLVEASAPTPAQLSEVRSLIQRHVELTGSAMGRSVLRRWQRSKRFFVRVVPRAIDVPAAEANIALSREEEVEPAGR